MIGLIVKLAIAGLIFYLVFSVYRSVKSMLSTQAGENTVPFAKAEACPACGERIRVARDEPGACPRCGVRLGRGPGGKLLVKIN